jgi:hypothetical protein
MTQYGKYYQAGSHKISRSIWNLIEFESSNDNRPKMALQRLTDLGHQMVSAVLIWSMTLGGIGKLKFILFRSFFSVPPEPELPSFENGVV